MLKGVASGKGEMAVTRGITVFIRKCVWLIDSYVYTCLSLAKLNTNGKKKRKEEIERRRKEEEEEEKEGRKERWKEGRKGGREGRKNEKKGKEWKEKSLVDSFLWRDDTLVNIWTYWCTGLWTSGGRIFRMQKLVYLVLAHLPSFLHNISCRF